MSVSILWLKFFRDELKNNPLIALVLILLSSNGLQYRDRVLLERDVRALVEQRIQEQKDKTREQEVFYRERLVETADRAATVLKLSELTREIQALKDASKKRRR